jgi:hypothetical protein
MFESEWTLLVRVTLHASSVGAGRESCLLEFETAMWIVTITALHGPFEYLVMGWQVELVLNFGVATQAKLGFARPQQLEHRETRFLSVRFRDEYV